MQAGVELDPKLFVVKIERDSKNGPVAVSTPKARPLASRAGLRGRDQRA